MMGDVEKSLGNLFDQSAKHILENQKLREEVTRLNLQNAELKYFIENYGGVAHLILTTTFDDDTHKWVKSLEDIVDRSVDPELLYWCAWCGVHRVEVENWADRPQCPAVVDAKKLKAGAFVEKPNGATATEDGFEVFTTYKNSTAKCPCGSQFTWEGLDERLDAWRDEHRPHLHG